MICSDLESVPSHELHCPPTLCRVHDKSCIYDVFTTSMRLAGVVWWVVFMLMCDEMQLGQGRPRPSCLSPLPSAQPVEGDTGCSVLLCWQPGQHIAAYPRAG